MSLFNKVFGDLSEAQFPPAPTAPRGPRTLRAMMRQQQIQKKGRYGLKPPVQLRRGDPRKEAPGSDEARKRLAQRARGRRVDRFRKANPEEARKRESAHAAAASWGGPAKYGDPYSDIK